MSTVSFVRRYTNATHTGSGSVQCSTRVSTRNEDPHGALVCCIMYHQKCRRVASTPAHLPRNTVHISSTWYNTPSILPPTDQSLGFLVSCQYRFQYSTAPGYRLHPIDTTSRMMRARVSKRVSRKLHAPYAMVRCGMMRCYSYNCFKV